MSEKIKRKGADRARDDDTSLDDTSLEAGLEGTFPASDPVSATRASKDEAEKPDKPSSEPTRPRRSDRKSER